MHLSHDTVTCMGTIDGFEMEIGFTDHFNTAINCSAVAHMHTLQISTAQAKSFQCAMSSPVVS
jgi:hypothetical protein